MTNDSTKNLQLQLTDHDGLGRITVDMEAFFEFSFWMAEELEDLVATYRHLAARGRSNRAGDADCSR